MEREQLILPMEVILELMNQSFADSLSYDLTVTGTSMSPTLLPYRDQVRLVSAAGKTFRKGDLIFAKRRMGGYMLHRVVRREPDGSYVLCGDGQQWVEAVNEQDVIALTVALRRKGKWISVTNPIYRAYVFAWAFTRPFRDTLVKIKQKLGNKR